MQEDLDKDLLAMFRDAERHVPEEPFTSAAAKLIERLQLRQRRLALLLRVAAVAAIAASSPWLIDASVLLSNALDGVFTAAGAALGTPAALLIAGICALPLVVRNRKLLF